MVNMGDKVIINGAVKLLHDTNTLIHQKKKDTNTLSPSYN